ncbi:hypothetical protein EMIT0196MI5_70126 [Pseudomonas sp. IT-196MI5]
MIGFLQLNMFLSLTGIMDYLR